MKTLGLTELKRLLVITLLVIGFALSIASAAIAIPFSFSQTLIAQTAESIPPESPQPSSTPFSSKRVEETVQSEQATTEQRPTQEDRQRPARETTTPRASSQSDRSSTQSPYDPYDMGAIRQFDSSWYGQ